MLFNHWNESLSTRLMQAQNQIIVIVLWSRHEMTHRLWHTHSQEENFGTMWRLTVARCIFEPSKVSLILTDLRCFTLPLSKQHIIEGQGSTFRVTVSQDNSSTLSQWMEFIQWLYILLGDMRYSTMNFLRKATPDHVQETPIFPAVGLGNYPFYSLWRENNSPQRAWVHS